MAKEKLPTISENKEEIFRYWNIKKIAVHRKMNHDVELEIGKALKVYTVEELKELIDLYATIFEPGVPEKEKKYFWTHKWNLYEFLVRGVRKFDGASADDYLKRQRVEGPEAIIFKRK